MGNARVVVGEPVGMRVLLPALALLLLIAGCGGDPEPPPPPAAPAAPAVAASASPVRDRVGPLLDQVSAAWLACWRDHGSQGRQERCASGYAIAATAATTVADTVELLLPNEADYGDVAQEARDVRSAYDRWEAAGCAGGYPQDAEPCTGHFSKMAARWAGMLIALEEVEPTS